jgi:hypothetical protein
MKPLEGQQSLFGPPRTARDEHDERPIELNSSVPDHEAPRLRPQHHEILARLREGPATNLELGMICQRFGARLNELRKAGIPWKKECVKAGIYKYTLIGE